MGDNNKTMAVQVNRVWHAISGEEALSSLETSSDGLSQEQVKSRLEHYGPNIIKKGKETSVWDILLHQIASPLIYVLLGAMALTLAIQHWADAIVIGIVVVLNAVIGFTQEYRAENAIQALIHLSAPKATVRRQGNRQEVDSSQLVPGDIVLLEAGGIVPADLRLLESTRLQIDESLLTGESVPSRKTTIIIKEDEPPADRDNMAFMGTAVVVGSGIGVVAATGYATQMGTIAKDILATSRAESPLQQRMKRFARWISLAILVIAAIAFVLGLALGEPLIDMFLTAVSLAVSAMPEGLPIVMTVALAVSVQRMAKHNAILRRLPAVEALGSCTIILTDKTGTLTQNRMTVKEIWAADTLYNVTGEGFIQANKAISGIEKNTPIYSVLLAGVLANEAMLKDGGDEPTSTGDPTEVALLVSGSKAGLKKDRLLGEYPLIDMISFDARQLYSASIHMVDSHKVVFIKGAPERILNMCDTQTVKEGQVKIDRNKIQYEARRMAEEGLRVLAMAVAENDAAVESVLEGKPIAFSFLGLQGMMDPPRADAAWAVSASHRAGIRVVMVTGDNPATALAVARKVGIGKDDAAAITGPEMVAMSDKELEATLGKTNVYARVAPSQKLRLVNILRQKGEIIAVTGDGVNDAPALKSAHIGVAMGKSGTDVAKEASEMVITDDNFATIYTAVKEGRTVFANIRKATFFLISSGIGEVILIITSIVLRFPLPLLPAQILWLNVVTNGVEDVALAFEPGEKQQYHRPPRDPKEGILSRLLIERSLIVGLVMAAGTLGMFMWARDGGASLEYARVVALTTLVTFQIFHVFNSRSNQTSILRMNPLSNKFLLIGTLLSFAVHLGAMYFEPTQNLLRLEPLDLDTWVRIVPVAFSVLVVVELHKMIRR